MRGLPYNAALAEAQKAMESAERHYEEVSEEQKPGQGKKFKEHEHDISEIEVWHAREEVMTLRKRDRCNRNRNWMVGQGAT